jgi:hypothetical protein
VRISWLTESPSKLFTQIYFTWTLGILISKSCDKMTCEMTQLHKLFLHRLSSTTAAGWRLECMFKPAHSSLHSTRWFIGVFKKSADSYISFAAQHW